MIRIGVRSFVAGGPSYVGILDTYTDAAAAYSVRLLRSAYTGSAIRVRRSSDNTEQNIGFNLSGGLDTTALTTFCGAGNGFVTTWYDQSGNGNNVVQTIAANQAQIVSSGSVILQNSKPALLFDGTNDSFLATTAIDPLFITAVNTPNTTANFKTIFGADTSDAVNVGSIYLQYTTPTRSATFARTTTADTNGANDFVAISNIQQTNNVVNLVTGLRTTTNIQIYTNGTLRTSDTTANNLRPVGGIDSGRFRLMAGYYGNSVADFLNGHLSEFIAYTTNQSSNRTGIETNINTYYGVY
jgi:hypothetical protein